MNALLQEIYIKPSTETRVPRLAAEAAQIEYALCNGQCKTGTCIGILPNDKS